MDNKSREAAIIRLRESFLDECEKQFELIWDGNPETHDQAIVEAYDKVMASDMVVILGKPH